MIPHAMQSTLDAYFSEDMLQHRVTRQEGRCYLELNHRDEQILSRLITTDELGPFLVVFLWDESDEDLDIGGYLVVDNLSMGSPTIGGIRMLPDIAPLDVHNLARGMTSKAERPICRTAVASVALSRGPALTAEEHERIIRGIARLLRRYQHLYLPVRMSAKRQRAENHRDRKRLTVRCLNPPIWAATASTSWVRRRSVITALSTCSVSCPRLRVLPAV